jgi:hypothetical protein
LDLTCKTWWRSENNGTKEYSSSVHTAFARGLWNCLES